MAQRPCPIDELPRGPGEEWRHIPGWGEAYAVSHHGRVARLAPSTRTVPGQILAGHIDRSSGHRTVQRTGPRAAGSPGRPVWEAFRGPVPPGMRVAHLDGAGTNERLENPALVPFSAGGQPAGRGAANANANLSNAAVAARIAADCQRLHDRSARMLNPELASQQADLVRMQSLYHSFLQGKRPRRICGIVSTRGSTHPCGCADTALP